MKKIFLENFGSKKLFNNKIEISRTMKQRIRLTESQLHKVIKESVKRILRENNENSNQQEVERIVKNLGSSIEEWYTPTYFSDINGCDGFIFNNEDEAYQYVLNGDYHQNAIDYVDGACPVEEWISILTSVGIEREKAANIINNGDWDSLVKIILDTNGPEWFLSQYSGKIYNLENGILYY